MEKNPDDAVSQRVCDTQSDTALFPSLFAFQFNEAKLFFLKRFKIFNKTAKCLRKLYKVIFLKIDYASGKMSWSFNDQDF